MPHAAKAKYPRFHGLAKHIDIWHHFIREWVNEEEIKLFYYTHRYADMHANVGSVILA
jgi:hypothetical protein